MQFPRAKRGARACATQPKHPACAQLDEPEVPNMPNLSELRVKLFLDGADLAAIRKFAADPRIAGFTTNPSLLHKAGVKDYAQFAREAIALAGDRAISFEVFADDFAAMEREARVIASWGGATYVKIPITNTKGESAGPLIRKLSQEGIALNVTAIFTLDQVRAAQRSLARGAASIISVFAGRVADTGIDPVPMMVEAASLLAGLPRAELLWASPRELLNIVQADQCGCHIITASQDILSRLDLLGRDPTEYSLEGVRVFHRDALASGLKIG
jgi:transaldolase